MLFNYTDNVCLLETFTTCELSWKLEDKNIDFFQLRLKTDWNNVCVYLCRWSDLRFSWHHSVRVIIANMSSFRAFFLTYSTVYLLWLLLECLKVLRIHTCILNFRFCNFKTFWSCFSRVWRNWRMSYVIETYIYSYVSTIKELGQLVKNVMCCFCFCQNLHLSIYTIGHVWKTIEVHLNCQGR